MAISFTQILRFFIFICVLFNINLAQAKPTLKDYGNLPEVQSVAISPSGDLVAFRKVTDEADRVTVISLSARKQLASIDVKAIKANGIYFLNEEQLILNGSELKKLEGYIDSFVVSTAFMYNLNDKSTRQLLIPGEEPVARGQMGLGSLIGKSPDGKFAYMPAFSFTTDIGPDVSLKLDEADYSLLKVNLKEKKAPSIVITGNKSTYDFFVDNNGNVLAQVSYDQKTNAHRVRARQNNAWVDIFKETKEVREETSIVGVTPDFKSLVVLDTDVKTGRIAYYTMSLSDGKLTGPLFGRDDADVEATIKNYQRVVYGVRYSGFSPSYHFFDAKLDQRMKDIMAKFPEQSVYLSDFSEDWKHLVVHVSGSNIPSEYYLFSEGKEPQFLTSSYPQVKAEDLHPTGKATFAARDGLKIPTLLTIPKDKVGAMKNLPTIIMPHGGPEAHDTIGFDWMAQAFAANGYLVIQPQFRGSDGFGLKHIQAGHGEWGKKMQDDVSDAVSWAVKKGLTDGNKVCIVGASYGGYSALAGGAFTPDLYKCVVAIAGVSNLKSFLDWAKFVRGGKSSAVSYWKRQFAKGSIDNAYLAAASPENYAGSFKAPVLLIHGEHDQTVPIDQSKKMNAALKSAGKNVKFIELNNETHHLEDNKTRFKTLEETVNFVNANIGQK